MELETKGVSVLTADIKATKAENGTYDITLSLPDLDRDDEVIDAKALQWMTSGRMPIDVDHGMTVLTTVGSGLPVYEGDQLKLADFRFASTAFAQDVKTLVDEEHVSKMSVTFMAAKREKDEKDGKIHIRAAELLNAAIVPIPSNREANILVRKSLLELAERDAKVGARNSEKDTERLQNIHDLAVANGALCGDARHVNAEVTEKSTEQEGMAAAPAPAVVPQDLSVAKARALAARAQLMLLTPNEARDLIS